MQEVLRVLNRNRVAILGLASAVLAAVAAGAPAVGIAIAAVAFLQRSQAYPAQEVKQAEVVGTGPNGEPVYQVK